MHNIGGMVVPKELFEILRIICIHRNSGRAASKPHGRFFYSSTDGK